MERDSFRTKSRKTRSAQPVVKETLSQGLGRHPEGPIDSEVDRNSYGEGTSLKLVPKIASNYIDQGTLGGGQNSGYVLAIAAPGLPYSPASKHQVRPNGNSSCSGCRVEETKTRPKMYMLRSQVPSNRALRSRQKPEETDLGKDVMKASREGSKRKGKKKSRNDLMVDEYLRIRSHLRYLMSRMNYETSLITAYSAEGWKGLSLEKLKPEKELQRATSQIVRLKLRIRDLFQHIDSTCATGRLPESLFDSEGEISSEDVGDTDFKSFKLQ